MEAMKGGQATIRTQRHAVRGQAGRDVLRSKMKTGKTQMGRQNPLEGRLNYRQEARSHPQYTGCQDCS